MATRIKTRIRQKIDIEARWIENNPILREGEIGFTSDGEHKNWFKLGDGVTPWTELKYAYSEFMAGLLEVDNVTIEKDENNVIRLKDNNNIVSGAYGASYDEANQIFTVPSLTVNSKGLITDISDKRVQIKQTINVIPVEGEYTVSSNYALIAGRSTVNASCIVNVPSMPVGTHIIIKNTSPDYALIVRPRRISIDKYTDDIILAPYDFITLVSISSVEWSIISESSRFDVTQLSTMALQNNVIVRSNTTGNSEQGISTMSLNTDNVATV